MTFGSTELVVILVLLFFFFIFIGPQRIARILGGIAKVFRDFISGIQSGSQGISENVGQPVNNKIPWVFVIIGMVGGYILGSRILPMLVYTSWERHVVETDTSGYTNALREAYSNTSLLGGIVGAIILTALVLVMARVAKK